ncbi:glycosyltransferase [Nocardioides sp. TF02-7]|uniref:glycosyltransferase n=1 Tax=Nocardioides sp. TF02-7 TaxID=2917724 RepID=UPI001F05A16E|nr:glycosyltransferase [Nocardioides sp. TF02-7]UMG93049.1 glycosyltransferase family 2 protein [Nocardioides sp. TF02-7]
MTSASAPSGSLAGLAVYTMFGGDPRQLLAWCNVHLGLGAEQLYVFLDRPSPALVAALPAHERVRWEAVDATTWETHYPPGARNVERKQVDGFRLAARMAAADGHRHLAFVDADELLDLSRPFAAVAAEAPDAVAFRFPVREMWYDAGDPVTDPFGATLAVGRPATGRMDWSRVLGWRAQFLRNGVLGHHAGKTVHRLPLAVGDLTVHGPRSLPGAPVVDVPEESGRVLHFDSGSVDTWTAKWGGRLGGGTVATGLGPHRRAQQRLFEHALRMPAPQRRAFFEDFYVLDEQARDALAERGLVRRVDVSALTAGPLPTDVPDDAVPAPPVVPGRRRDRVDFQFALVCDKRFVKPTFATMTSVLSQVGDRGSVRFVVLGDGIDGADVSRLRALEHTRYDVEVVVHDVTADLDRDVGTEDAKRATFGRIYLIDHLPPQRTVYLDGDVLATRDFTELFDRDLGGACLAGVSDSAALRLVANPANVPVEQRNRLVGITGGDPLEYLNGGVLVFDLDNPDFRELALRARALVVLQGRALKQRDQDAMNIAFTGRKHRLESTYNYMTQFYASDRVLDGDLTRLKYDAADASLIHFSGRIKPWESPDDEFYNGLYRKLVLEAERTVGVSCEFYFSEPPVAPRASWTAARWAEVLGASTPGRSVPAGPATTDLAVVDVGDAGVHLTMSAEMLEHARAHDLRLVGRTADATVVDAPLTAVGPVLNHLVSRVAPGTRLLALDLAGGALRNRWRRTRPRVGAWPGRPVTGSSGRSASSGCSPRGRRPARSCCPSSAPTACCRPSRTAGSPAGTGRRRPPPRQPSPSTSTAGWRPGAPRAPGATTCPTTGGPGASGSTSSGWRRSATDRSRRSPCGSPGPTCRCAAGCSGSRTRAATCATTPSATRGSRRPRPGVRRAVGCRRWSGCVRPGSGGESRAVRRRPRART